MMRKIELTEWSPFREIPREKGGRLGPNDRRLLPRLRKAGIVIDELATGLRIRTKSFVGRVTLDAFDLLVHPKLEGTPLYELFRYAFNLKQLHPLGKQVATDKFFEEILIAELLGEAREIQRRGAFQQYRKEHKNLTELRGRIDRTAWLRRGGVASETLPCVFYRRSHDNVLNRALCGGLRLGATLSRLSEVKTGCRMLADAFVLSFPGMATEQPLSGRLIADAFRHLNRLNAHYEQALRLVRLLESI